MCAPLDKIKLCTCALGEEKPANYWILYCYEENRDIQVMGEAVMPYLPKDHELKEENLLQVLNERDCFDKPMQLKSKDRLEIHLNLKEEGYEFLFEFKVSRWKIPKDSDPFWVENSYRKIKTGVIESNPIN